MCGRFVSTQTPEEIASFFDAAVEVDPLPVSYNVAPTDDVYAVVADAQGERAVRAFHWGLVPSWAKDIKIGASLINARAESVATKPAFKAAFKKYRCLVPMDGFYEWRAAQPGGPVGKNGKPRKQPMYVHSANGEPLAVAGLWSVWRDREAGPDAPWLHSLTIITTDANETMAEIHDRMPVVLPESAWNRWLDPREEDLDALAGLLVPAPTDLLTMQPVSLAVNNVRNKGPEVLDPETTAVAAPAPQPAAEPTLFDPT